MRLPHFVAPALFCWVVTFGLTANLVAQLSGTPAALDKKQLLDKQQLLEAQTFWDNRDWDWYQENIPFLDSPDDAINSTYYYRWEVVTKHLTYGSPQSGYSYTEFIDRPFWSGTYGAISCPAGHQLYEVRWLRNKAYAQDYARYWFQTPGAQPRNYSTWLADSVWAVQMAHGDRPFALELLPALAENYKAWKASHYVPEVGMFWQTGHDDGMEFNINSRQTQDILRGAPSYRPSFNAYMYGDAVALAKLYELAGEPQRAAEYRQQADDLKLLVENKLWDPQRRFFFPMFKQDEQRDGFVNEALTLTYQTGKYASSPHGRELIGYVPWQFNLPADRDDFASAWRFLLDRDYFWADYGPSFVERRDPQFLITDYCCWWSGQSWPYATTQTLVAMANLLNNYSQNAIDSEDYFQVLKTYSLTHRKDGRPYIAEAANPDTGSWQGYDNYNHSEHYLHSGYCDLIVTGLAGLRPRDDEMLEVNPLLPAAWDYFALVDIPYRDRLVSIIWDRAGDRYGMGAGMHLVVDGKTIAAAAEVSRLEVPLPEKLAASVTPPRYNFAVNNEGSFYPQMKASHTGRGTSPMTLQDGNYWYHITPPNRWTNDGSDRAQEWLEIDFGTPRYLDEAVLYPLDDGQQIVPPAAISLEYWQDDNWQPVSERKRRPQQITGRRANHIYFEMVKTTRLRALLTPAEQAATGLTEFAAWGPQRDTDLTPPSPPSSLATNVTGDGFPRATASHTSPYDRVEFANDGKINYRPTPNNRWTAYQSPDSSDWLEIDFGKAEQVQRIELHLYDDRGGVQAPTAYTLEYWDQSVWKPVANLQTNPVQPQGGAMNTATFTPVTTKKIRVVFQHRGPARSGLTEINVWP
ncbi:MGH1-like glycoside hydrolase domain-containing protein [Planctomycetaceae bacterium SH139]